MEKKLKELFEEMFVFEQSQIDLNQSFKEYGLDSLDFVEFIMTVEDNFDADISEEDAEKFKCLNDILKHLENVED